MKFILLKKNKSRIAFDCVIKGIPMIAWVDTGSPNTLVPVDFINRSGTPPIKGTTYNCCKLETYLGIILD